MEMPGSTGERDGGGGRPPLHFILPALWIAFLMALGLRSLYSSWPLLAGGDLPEDVATWLWFGIAVAVINLFWGSWLLGLAYRRATTFPAAFTLWQVFNIAAILVSTAYTSFSGSFVPQAFSLMMVAAEVVLGIALIALVRRTPIPVAAGGAAGIGGEPPGERPSLGVYLLNAVIGAVIGAIALVPAGLLLGSVIADLADISCFEGGCGYFALAIGVAGLPVGLVVGAVVAVWLAGRRPRPRRRAS